MPGRSLGSLAVGRNDAQAQESSEAEDTQGDLCPLCPGLHAPGASPPVPRWFAALLPDGDRKPVSKLGIAGCCLTNLSALDLATCVPGMQISDRVLDGVGQGP
jgi:hypothetical protein